MKRVCITTGDPDGIGFEIADKALAILGPVKGVQFILWKHKTDPQKLSDAVSSQFHPQQVYSLDEALSSDNKDSRLIEIASLEPPIEWVRQSSLAALSKKIDALCTGPISKTSPGAEGGHTGIFRSLVKQPLFMLFLGSKFHVALVTDHIRLNQVEHLLSAGLVRGCISSLDTFKKNFPNYFSNASINVLGLNPHSGESGIIGSWERDVLHPTLSELQKSGIEVRGPLVPDAAFTHFSSENPDFYVALYHDQGLIPFKLVHRYDEGVQLTLGLPFIRTSVDHGTAKDLFGKNSAHAGSMRDALEWALKLTGAKN